jgi:hypothetical protein
VTYLLAAELVTEIDSVKRRASIFCIKYFFHISLTYKVYIFKMTQNMDVDFDVPKFLYEERQKSSPQLQHYFATFEDLYERK